MRFRELEKKCAVPWGQQQWDSVTHTLHIKGQGEGAEHSCMKKKGYCPVPGAVTSSRE